MPTSTDTTATAVTDEAASRLPKLIAWLEGRMMFKEAADVRAILTAALPHMRQAAEPVAVKPGGDTAKLIAEIRSGERDGFLNEGDAEAQWIADSENACPHCGGSGHKDDAASPAQQEPVAVPAGWRLVPEEPTEEQHDAARDWSAEKYGKPIGTDASHGCYRAMLAAAPASPADDRLREVVEALEAFAKLAAEAPANARDHDMARDWRLNPTVGQLRRARSLLARLHTRGDASHG